MPLHMNHQHKNPTSPPTTTTAATEIPAMAPLERLAPLLLAVSSLHEVAGDGTTVARWSRAGDTAPDACDTPAAGLAGRACAAREVVPSSTHRPEAQTHSTVPQVGLREAGGSQSGTARCGGGSGDRRPSKTNHRPPCGTVSGCV